MRDFTIIRRETTDEQGFSLYSMYAIDFILPLLENFVEGSVRQEAQQSSQSRVEVEWIASPTH
jgi:hypothetical protein